MVQPFFLASLTKELLFSKVQKEIHIEVFLKSNSLFETLNTTKSVLDRRLCIEISTLTEKCEKKEMSIQWKQKQYQLSDPLTKFHINSLQARYKKVNLNYNIIKKQPINRKIKKKNRLVLQLSICFLYLKISVLN